MNILPQKNWHVRTKKNIEKVRKDEEKAMGKQKAAEKRQEIAESEARVNLLRSRTGASSQLLTNTEERHFVLFDQKRDDDKNPEAQAEKRIEKEKFEKKIGLLKYLHDDSLDLKSSPWYQTTKRKNDDGKGEIDLKHKSKDDPLAKMRSQMNSDDKDKDEKNKKNKKLKSEKESPQKPTASNTSSNNGKKTIEQLRAERLKRETEERIKAEKLLNPTKFKQPEVEFDDRKRKFNNQFNPTLSKY